MLEKIHKFMMMERPVLGWLAVFFLGMLIGYTIK
jgi:hypothetical protein